nr:hypothetical protein CFP56_53601 [Quercus suber]
MRIDVLPTQMQGFREGQRRLEAVHLVAHDRVLGRLMLVRDARMLGELHVRLRHLALLLFRPVRSSVRDLAGLDAFHHRLHQPQVDLAQLEPLLERRKFDVGDQRRAEHDRVGRDRDAVGDLVGPDVRVHPRPRHLHQVLAQRAHDPDVLLGDDVPRVPPRPRHARVEVVDDVGLAQPLDALRHGRRELELEGPLHHAGLDLVGAVDAHLVFLVPEDPLVRHLGGGDAAHQPPTDLALALEPDLGFEDAHGFRGGEAHAASQLDRGGFMFAAMKDDEARVREDVQGRLGFGTAVAIAPTARMVVIADVIPRGGHHAGGPQRGRGPVERGVGRHGGRGGGASWAGGGRDAGTVELEGGVK